MPKDYSRTSRINVQLQRELGELIRDELTDPRVTNTTVTRVDVSPDLRNARVFISVMGDDARAEPAAKALNHAAGKLRHGLGVRLSLRHLPQLHFVVDAQLVQASKLNYLIRDAVRSDEANHATEPKDDGKPSDDRDA